MDVYSAFADGGGDRVHSGAGAAFVNGTRHSPPYASCFKGFTSLVGRSDLFHSDGIFFSTGAAGV